MHSCSRKTATFALAVKNAVFPVVCSTVRNAFSIPPASARRAKKKTPMIGVKVGYFGYVIGIIYSLYVTTEFILAD